MNADITPNAIPPNVDTELTLAMPNTGEFPITQIVVSHPDFINYLNTNYIGGGSWHANYQPQNKWVVLTADYPTEQPLMPGETLTIGMEVNSAAILAAGAFTVSYTYTDNGHNSVAASGNLNISTLGIPPQNTEKLIIEWLQSLPGVAGWPVSGDKPGNNPDQYILVDRTGGPREYMVLDRAALLVEFYHKTSRLAASDLANYVADMVPQLPAFAESITGASVNSLVNLDSLTDEYHRYQLYLDVNNRR